MEAKSKTPTNSSTQQTLNVSYAQSSPLETKQYKD